MTQRAFLRFGLGAAILALPVAALFGYFGPQGASAQQGFPPDPPMVLYGTASGSTPGQGVHAYVNANGRWTWCGVGTNVAEGYVVQVHSESQTPGCGAAGRSVRLYFTPLGEGETFNGAAGRLSSGTTTWSSDRSEPSEYTVNLNAPLQAQGAVPALAVRVDN